MYKIYNTPFDWKTWNCCSSVAEYYRRHYALDLEQDFAGKYETPIQAYRMIARRGGLEAILLQKGFKPINKGMARSGDVVLHYFERRGYTCGLVNGSVAVFAGGRTLPMSKIDKVYRHPAAK